METLRTNGEAYRNYMYAEDFLSGNRQPFELVRIARAPGVLHAILSVPTEGIDPVIQIGEAPYEEGQTYDQAVLKAIQAAARVNQQETSISGTIVNFTTREHTIFLDQPGNTWIASGMSFEEAATNGLAAMASRNKLIDA